MTKTAFALLLILSGSAMAADPYMVINGTSSHFGVSGYNEQNTGIGAEVRKLDDFCTAGVLKNSMSDTSIYLGCGHRWWAGSRTRIGAGFFAGAVRYPSSKLNTLPALLPVLSVESRNFGVNLIVIPAVTEDMVTAVLAQAYIKL